MKIPRNPFSEEPEDLGARHLYLTIAVALFFAILVFRLWYLQIIHGYEYRLMSESNRTRIQETLSPRGLIYDRNGLLLVDNLPSYELAVVREDVTDSKELTRKIAYHLGLPWAGVEAAYEATRSQPSFTPAVMLTDLNLDNVVALKTHQYELPGVIIEVKPKRRYLYDNFVSHVIGYLGEVTKEQLEKDQYRDHRAGDMAGQYGIERIWESVLYGRRGRSLVEVNASGRVQRVIETAHPVPGQNLYLTLDMRMQKIAQEALTDQAGAVVGVNPKNGEILFMASNPTFSSNDFVQGMTNEKWQELMENPLHPLENRAIAGRYPPGSTFKIVSATAILEEMIADVNSRVVCRGAYPLGDRDFHCWNRGGHGSVDFHYSLLQSCDIYYYDMSLKLGINDLAKYARAFGLGATSGVELSGEQSGVVPDKAWKKEKLGRNWTLGETLNAVIGQGYILTTPLQMAMATSVIANGGILYKPRIVRKITDAEDNLVRFFQPEVVRDLQLDPATVKAVQDGLVGVINEPGGTGSRGRLKDVIVAGKTGTAQVITLEKYQRVRGQDRPYKYRDHAWFIAFAPADDPQVAMAVLIEHGGGGGAAAAPIAQKILDAFFHPQPETPQNEGEPEPNDQNG